MVCDSRPAYGKTGQFPGSYDTQTVIPTILRPSFLPYPFHPYHTLTFIPPKIYRPGWKPL